MFNKCVCVALHSSGSIDWLCQVSTFCYSLIVYSRSHETLHELKQLFLVDHTITVFVDLVEECIANGLIERFFVADLRKSCLRERHDLISVKGTGAILVVFRPQSINNRVPFRATITTWSISHLSCS